MRHPSAREAGCAASGSRFRRLVLSSASSRADRPGSANRSRATIGGVLDPARVDLEQAVTATLGQVDHPLEERRPHVELHLLGHAQVPIEEIGEPVAAARPRLDREREPVALARGAELDLPGLEVARERCEAEGGRRDLDDADGPVPWPRHAHDVLVADGHRALVALDLVERRELARRHPVGVGGDPRDERLGGEGRVAHTHAIAAVKERPAAVLRTLELVGRDASRERRGAVLPGRALDLRAAHRRRTPHVAPRGEADPQRPVRGDRQVARQGGAAGHGAHLPGSARRAPRGVWRAANRVLLGHARRDPPPVRPPELADARRLGGGDRPVRRPVAGDAVAARRRAGRARLGSALAPGPAAVTPATLLLAVSSHTVRSAITTGGYPALALLVLLENLFPPIPSEVVLPLAGYYVERGTLTFVPAVAAATAGLLAGALILYGLGRIGGRPLVLRYGRFLRVDDERLRRAEDWFARYGDAVVLFARMVPGARSVVSVPPGSLGWGSSASASSRRSGRRRGTRSSSARARPWARTGAARATPSGSGRWASSSLPRQWWSSSW